MPLRERIKGFTLIELLVVVAIIGLLAAVVVVPLNNARIQAGYKKNLETDAAMYHNLGDSLILQYLFEGDLIDSSGSRINAALGVGTLAYSSTTPFGTGSSLSLDGATYVNIPINITSECGFTISSWSYFISGVGGQPWAVMFANNSTLQTAYGYNGVGIGMELYNNVSGYQGYTFSSNGSYQNKWAFVTLTSDQNHVRGYVDGVLVWTGNPIGCVTMSGFRIGRWSNYLQGYVDNFRIYDRALDTAEIQKLYAMDAPRHGVAFVGPAPWSLGGVGEISPLR